MKPAKSAQKRRISPLLAGIGECLEPESNRHDLVGRGILSPVGRAQNHEVTAHPGNILTKTDDKSRSTSRFPRKRGSAFLFGARRGNAMEYPNA